LLALIPALAACGTPDRPELDYLPPSGEPARGRSAFVQQQPWLVWGNLLDHLQQQRLGVIEIDEPSGEIVVEYRGDPEPYVDCGWIVVYGEDDLDQVPAARSESSFRRRIDGEIVELERDLRLDARMNVKLEPDGDATLVRADSTYRLTKTVTPEDADEPLHQETVRFGTGETATFASTTTCQPNGELERLVLDALPAVSVAGGRGRRGRIVGTSRSDRRTASQLVRKADETDQDEVNRDDVVQEAREDQDQNARDRSDDGLQDDQRHRFSPPPEPASSASALGPWRSASLKSSSLASILTGAVPFSTMSSRSAASLDRSITRPSACGPRSLISTSTDLPFSRLVTSAVAPSGSSGCAAVRSS
jgi:hypothetical protein